MFTLYVAFSGKAGFAADGFSNLMKEGALGFKAMYLLVILAIVAVMILVVRHIVQKEARSGDRKELLSLFLLTTMSLVVCVADFGVWKIGSSPFISLKDAFPDAPIFASGPDFAPVNGKGLNSLLQNYWMVIHPPTLFLGFASTTIPSHL
ncbi:MAG: hypothetical protein U0176_08590 [Bacteroidia bacterium]